MERIITLIWVVIFCGRLLTQGQQDDEVCRPEPFVVHPNHLSASSAKSGYPAHSGVISAENVLPAWCASEKNTKQWLQIDLQKNKDLLAVALQGLYDHSWVESFYLQYSSDEETWYCYGSETGHKLFPGNDNDKTVKVHVLLLDTIFARYVRINPQSWHNDLCLRTELYGCKWNPNGTYDIRPPMYNNTCGIQEPTEPPTIATETHTTTIEEKVIVIPVSHFDLELPDDTVRTNELIFIGVSIHEGTEVVYNWDLGNQVVRGVAKTLPHMYSSPGVYNVEVTASNSNNSYTNRGTIVVQDPIDRLNCLGHNVAAKPMEKVLIRWILYSGTNVTFKVNVSDGNPEQVLQSFADNYREISLVAKYDSVGIREILINAENDVDEKETKCTVIVEDPIANLSLFVPPPRMKVGSQIIYIAVGESVTIKGELTSGTSVSCDFDFGEKVLAKSVDVYEASYSYERTGNYTIGLTCMNLVSTVSRTHTKRIVVQEDEEINDLDVVVNVTNKVERSVFMLVKRTGTAFVCNWTLGDGTAFQTDISDINSPVLHKYAVEGSYDVFVRCVNRHGVVETKSVARVQIPIIDLTCNSMRTFLKTSDQAVFNISIHSGSHVTLRVKFEKNETHSVSFTEGFNGRKFLHQKHSFTSNGSYHVQVKAFNFLGTLTRQCEPVVVVQNPLRDISVISDKTVVKVADEVIFYLSTSVSEQFLPTDASCVWSFGEDSQVKEMRLVFNQGIVILHHRYLYQGSFKTSVNCSNEVSQISVETSVTVLEPVKPVMKVCFQCDYFTNISELTSRKYFALGEKATFLLTSQDFDRVYHWTMTAHGSLGNTTKPYLSVFLNKTGIFTTTVEVDKVVERLSASVTFTVQEKIIGVLFTSSGFTWLRSATSFKLAVSKFHYGDCFVVSFNSSFSDVTDCASSSTYGESNTFELSFNRTFADEGSYNICVSVFNKVSDERHCILVIVKKPTCKIVNVSIWDSNRPLSVGIEETDLQTKYNRSQEFQLDGHFINNCLLPDSEDAKLSWQIRRITVERGEGGRRKRRRRDLESSRVVWESDGSNIVVFARSLTYGEYYFVFSVELTSPDVISLYGLVDGQAVVKVEVVRSPIAGRIAGERLRDVDIEKQLRLETAFYDPDMPPGSGLIGMIYEWYCRTQDETSDLFVHCFEKGKNYETFPIASLTSSLFRTSLDRYIANRTYIFSVKAMNQDDGRTAKDEVSVFVLPPGPPLMLISCDQDCSGNLRPSEDLRLEAICQGQCISFQLSFRWELYERSGDEWTRIDPPEELGMASRNRDFLIRSHIFQNILGPGGECLVKLEVRREGGRAGYLSITLKVNEPPEKGNCSCTPPTGELANTEFQVFCENWMDPDTPLRYSFTYGEDEKPILTSLEDSTSSRKFRIYKNLPEEITSVSIPIRVSVEDALGMSSELTFFLEVKNAPMAPVDLDSVLDDLDSDDGNSTTEISNPEEARAETQKVVNLLEQLLLSDTDDQDQDGGTSDGGGNGDAGTSGSSSGGAGGGSGGNGGSGGSGGSSGGSSGSSGGSSGGSNGGSGGGGSGSSGGVGGSSDSGGSSNSGGSSSSSGGGQGQHQSGAGQPGSNEIAVTIAPTKPPMSAKEIQRAKIIEKSLSKLQAVTNVLANSETTSVSELLVISDAVVRVTENNEVLTQNARGSSIDLISNIVAAVDKPDASAASLEKMAVMIGKAVTNLLKSILDGSPVSLDDPFYRCDDSVKESGREASRKILKIMNDMLTAVLKAKSPGDEDTVFNTTLIRVVLHKALANTLNDSTIGSDLGLFTLPKLGLFQNGVFMDDSLGLQMVSFDGNPYDDCEKEANTTTSVLSLEVQQWNGSTVSLNDLLEEIVMTIRTSEVPFDSFMDTFILEVNKTGYQFHRFNHSLEDVALGIEFFSEENKIDSWDLMVAHGKRPSMQSSLAKWSANGNKSKLFLLESSFLTDEGTYYVKVQGKSSWSLRKSKAFNASYSLRISTVRCFFWKETTEMWSSEGCRAGVETSSGEVQCLCNHLTSFAGQVLVVPNVIDFDKPLVRVFLELLMLPSSNEIVLPLVISTFCVYLLLLVWARRLDVRNSKKAEIVKLEDNKRSNYHKYEILVLTGMRKGAGTTADVCCDLIGLDGDSGPRLLGDPNMERFQRSGMDAFLLTSPYHLGELTSLKIWHNNSGSSPSWYLKEVIVRDLSDENVFVFLCNRWLAVELDDGEVLRELPAAKKDELKSFNRLFCSGTQKNITDKNLWFSVFLRPELSSFSTVQRLSCCLALFCCTMLANVVYYEVDNEQPDSSVLSDRQLIIGLITSTIIFPLHLAIGELFRNIRPSRAKKGKKQSFKKNNCPERSKAYKGDFENIVEWYRTQELNDDELNTGNIAVGLPPVETVDEKAKTTEWLNRNLGSCDDESPFAGFAQNEWHENEGDFRVSVESNVEVQVDEKFGTGPGSIKEKKEQLPDWFLYVAWLVVFLLTSLSVLFVILYGLHFGVEKAVHWLVSLLIALVQDSLVSQPIIALFVSLVNALLIRKPEEQVSAAYLECNEDNDDLDYFHENREPKQEFPEFEKFMYRRYEQHTSIKIEPLSPDELDEARALKQRDIRMYQILKEIVLYVFFLLALCMVSFGQRDPKAFLVSKLIEDTYLGGVYAGTKLNEGDGISNYWKWIEGGLLPSLSSSSRDWAVGCHPLQEYTIDCNSRLVGGARIRQLRIKSGECQVPEPMQETLQGCNDYYSIFKEDKDNYTVGWERTNKTSNITSSPWYYRSRTELGGLPFLGVTATYGGGGYAFDVGVTNVTDVDINSLKENSWIDARTRAIFVEIAIYSAQVNMFGVATFLTEWIPTNGVVFFNNIKVTRLYRHGNDFDSIMVACEIFLAVFFAIFLYNELKQMFKLGKRYFKDPWNWLEISLIILILTGAAALFQRTSYTKMAIDAMKANPNQFVSFVQATTWDELFGYLLAFLVFFANIKFLKLIRFNHRIFLFTRTLSTSAMPLLSFMVVFFVFYIAYSVLFYSFYGALLAEYQSFTTTIETLFNTVMGGFDFEILRENNRLWGPVIFFSFMMIMVMILMNVFLTILMDAFAEVQEDAENLKSKDAEVVDYMLDQFKQYFSRSGKVGNLPENDYDISPNELESSRSDSERDNYNTSENWLDGSQQELLRTVEPLQDSFPCIKNSLDHDQLGPSEHYGERTSPTWPSLVSLRRELQKFRRVSVSISNNDSADPAEIRTEGNASCIFTASADAHELFSSKNSTVSRTDQEENSDKSSMASYENSYEYDSGRHSPSSEYSQNSRCFTVENSEEGLKTSLESSSGYCSSFAGTVNSKGKSEMSMDSEVSHYYDLLERAVDQLRDDDDSVRTSLENQVMDSDLLHYYNLLEKAAKEQRMDSKNTLEKFDFTNYQVRFNNIGNKPPEEIELERILSVEPMLSHLLGNFASVAMSEIQEDQIFEQLVMSYVTVLNEISFEPDLASIEKKLLKKFDEKAKWKYTRHMFTQA